MAYGDYPHMGRADSFLWDRFLRDSPGYFQAPSYDVRVGEGAELPGALEEPYRTMATQLSQKRIDVVALRRGERYIIEIKPCPGTSALGQLLTYRTLYALEHPEESAPEMALLCARLDRDDRLALERQGVRVLLVEITDEELLSLERGVSPPL